MAGRRRGEAGLLRGCCFGLVLLLVAAVAGGFLLLRALSAPETGAAPAGPAHGDTPGAIAVTVAARVVDGLTAGDHVTVTLSERDLTVIAAAQNPDATRFRNPEVRVRDGRLLVTARTTVGPFETTTSALIVVDVDALHTPPHVTGTLKQVDVGRLTLPDWLRSTYDARVNSALDLDRLLANPALQPARANLDCVRVVSAGIALGFHRPGVAADANGCTG